MRSRALVLVTLSAFLSILLSSGASSEADSPVPKDRVTVKGATLEGEISRINKKKLAIETVYGDGEIVIDIVDVEAIETGVPFHVFRGEDDTDTDTAGRLVHVTEKEVRVASEDGTVTSIPFDEVFVIQRQPDPDADLMERAELALPYWDGSFDLAYNMSRATDDTLGLATGLNLERERGPSLLRMRTSWRFGKENNQGAPVRTSENQIIGEISQRYDMSGRWFVQGSIDGMYDEVESLSLRSVPKLGAGYKLYDSEELTLSIAAGPAYVYQRYFGGSTEDYAALGFGTESKWDLPWGGAVWYTRLGYTPSLTDWTTKYLVRGETWLKIPLGGPFAFKASILNIYNNSPKEGTDKNSLNTSVGISAGF